MTNTIAQGIAYAKAHPTRDGGTWNQWCQSFVYRFFFVSKIHGSWQDTGGRTAPSAYKAYLVTKQLGQIYGHNWSDAPAGAVHYWAYSKDNPGDGHVAVATKAGGEGVWMASARVQHLWGTAMGTTTISAYTAKTGLYYLGWGSFVGQTLSGTVLDPKKIAAAKASSAEKARAAKAAQLRAQQVAAAKAIAAQKAAAAKAAAEKAEKDKEAKAAAEKAAYQLKLKQHVNNVPIYVGIEGKPERYAMAGKKVLRHVPPAEYDDAKETGFVATLLQPGQLDGYKIIDY